MFRTRQQLPRNTAIDDGGTLEHDWVVVVDWYWHGYCSYEYYARRVVPDDATRLIDDRLVVFPNAWHRVVFVIFDTDPRYEGVVVVGGGCVVVGDVVTIVNTLDGDCAKKNHTTWLRNILVVAVVVAVVVAAVVAAVVDKVADEFVLDWQLIVTRHDREESVEIAVSAKMPPPLSVNYCCTNTR